MVKRYRRVILMIAVASLTAIFYFLPSNPLQTAAALGNPCALDSQNLIVNGSMAAADPDEGVASGWNSFTLSGNPTFEHVDNEQIDPNGSQYFWETAEAFDAGIFQTVDNLAPGNAYHFWLGYALAAYDPGIQQNLRDYWIGRQVGVDPTGGTDPTSPTVMWGSVYWNGYAALNIPDLSMTFSPQTNHATIFLRAINTNTDYLNKVWFDSVCMETINRIHLPMISTAP